MKGKKRLADLAKEISSKNAGNYFLTFDIVFDDSETYARVKASGVIAPDLVSRIYRVPAAEALVIPFDQGRAFKITIRRPWVAGDIGESDIFGAQQYAPLLDVTIPWPDDVK